MRKGGEIKCNTESFFSEAKGNRRDPKVGERKIIGVKLTFGHNLQIN